MIIPLRNVSNTAKSGPNAACSAVIKDIMAVGPTVMSLELPKMQYMKQPMKAEYNPYWKKSEIFVSNTKLFFVHFVLQTTGE